MYITHIFARVSAVSFDILWLGVSFPRVDSCLRSSPFLFGDMIYFFSYNHLGPKIDMDWIMEVAVTSTILLGVIIDETPQSGREKHRS